MQKRTLTCVQCSATFQGVTASCCSAQCRVLRRKTAQRSPCRRCGASLADRVPNAKYCWDCVAQIRDETPRHKPKPKTVTACAGCGTQFDPPRSTHFCTKQCSGRYGVTRQFATTIIKTCTACDEPFTTVNPRRNECSGACRNWRWRYPGTKRILEIECVHCLTPFRRIVTRQKYCTLRCQREVSATRRRARTQFIEPVSKKVIAERDKWVCGLCRKRVDPRLQWPHPMSWSLDHIIPIACGGEHSYANTQLAHLRCNVSKKHQPREPQQLALIG